MEAVPVAPPPPPPSVVSPPPPGGGGLPLAPFDRPTDRPNEPLTHGLSTGQGAGPEILSMPADNPSMDELRAIYLRYPTEQLRELIEDADL